MQQLSPVGQESENPQNYLALIKADSMFKVFKTIRKDLIPIQIRLSLWMNKWQLGGGPAMSWHRRPGLLSTGCTIDCLKCAGTTPGDKLLLILVGTPWYNSAHINKLQTRKRLLLVILYVVLRRLTSSQSLRHGNCWWQSCVTFS